MTPLKNCRWARRRATQYILWLASTPQAKMTKCDVRASVTWYSNDIPATIWRTNICPFGCERSSAKCRNSLASLLQHFPQFIHDVNCQICGRDKFLRHFIQRLSIEKLCWPIRAPSMRIEESTQRIFASMWKKKHHANVRKLPPWPQHTRRRQ